MTYAARRDATESEDARPREMQAEEAAVSDHTRQRNVWDLEHERPVLLPQVSSETPSGGVKRFWAYLEANSLPRASGIEIGCGKGRNTTWLAAKGASMTAFDFSDRAIREARRRTAGLGIADVRFDVADAAKEWPYEDAMFDFAIDCFATTEIETIEARRFTIAQMRRVLRPGGIAFAYLPSTDDEFNRQMIAKRPGAERNTFYYDSGKFEKTFDAIDLLNLYRDFDLLCIDRVAKCALIQGETYSCKHFWAIFRSS